MSNQIEMAKKGGLGIVVDFFGRRAEWDAFEYNGHVIAVHEWPWGAGWIDIWRDGERVGTSIEYRSPNRSTEIHLAKCIIDGRAGRKEDAKGVEVVALVAVDGCSFVPDPSDYGTYHVYRKDGTRDGVHVHRFHVGGALLVFWSEDEAKKVQAMYGIDKYTAIKRIRVEEGVL